VINRGFGIAYPWYLAGCWYSMAVCSTVLPACCCARTLARSPTQKQIGRKRFGAPFGYARNASRGKDRKLPRLGWIRIVKFCKSAFHFVTFHTTGRRARIMIA